MTYEPTVLVTSQTAAEIHLAGEVDEVFASTQEGLRSRIVESIRLMAASAGEPVTATVVDGATRWALVVSPDGSFTEATAPAAVSAPAVASAPAAVSAPAASVSAPAATPGAEDVSSVAASSVAAPISAVPLSPAAAAAVAESVPAETAAEPAAAAPATSATTAVATATVDGPLRSGATRREGAQRTPAQRATPTVDDLLNSRADRARPRATEGWRGAIRRLTGGAISPRPGKAEQSRLDRERLVQRRLDAPRTIVVLNPKGGAHKTTSTLLLAATFGTQRGGATLAWDNNETRGTLGWRAQHAPPPPHGRRPARRPRPLHDARPCQPRRPRHLRAHAGRRAVRRAGVRRGCRGILDHRRRRIRSPARRAVALLPPADRRHRQ
ncbi:P-loop NTPase family protein [Microbacterium hominis]|uniref:hypothetical protein n=1 Tax=Microbacterium hominis TaxID=162426 RepID=UPI001CC31BCC|nr:hypothetical protein [Microbacterium hominis]